MATSYVYTQLSAVYQMKLKHLTNDLIIAWDVYMYLKFYICNQEKELMQVIKLK